MGERKIIDKVCWVCGKKFQTTYSFKRYCSKKCKQKIDNAKTRKLDVEPLLPYMPDEMFMPMFGHERLTPMPTKNESPCEYAKNKSIAEVVEEATAKGMSYGEYMRFLYEQQT